MKKYFKVILLMMLILLMTSCAEKNEKSTSNKEIQESNRVKRAEVSDSGTLESEITIPESTTSEELTCHVGGPICELCGEYYRGECLTVVGVAGYEFEVYENGIVITRVDDWSQPLPESYDYCGEICPLIEIEYFTVSSYTMKNTADSIKTNEIINGGKLKLPDTVVKLGNIRFEEFPFEELVIPEHIKYVCGDISIGGTEEPSLIRRIVFPEDVCFEQYDGEELVDSLTGVGFSNSRNLTEFEIPTICKSAGFTNCAIEEVVVPENIVSFGATGCWNLRNITYEPYAGTDVRKVSLRNLNLDKLYIPEGLHTEREGSSSFKNVYFNELEFSKDMDLSKLVFFLYLQDIDFEKEVSNMPAGLMTVEELASYYPTEYSIDEIVIPDGLKEVTMEFDTSENVTINQFIMPNNMESFSLDINDGKGMFGRINYMQLPDCWSDDCKIIEKMNKGCVFGVSTDMLEGFKAANPEYDFIEATYTYE